YFFSIYSINNSNPQNSSRPQNNPLTQPNFTPQPISPSQTASISATAQKCRVVVPTVGNSVRVFTQPSKDAYTGKKILKDTKVSFIGGRGEFVETKLADGTSGWVLSDRIYPCKVRSDSRSQIASISEQPQQSLIIAPTAGRGARIFTQPSRNAYLGRRIPQGTKVSLLREQQEFVEIKLPDNTQGWVFNDQVHPYTVSDSSLPVASISVTAQQCRVLMPTVGSSARVFTQPSREAYTGKRIPKDSKVSFISGRGEFVEIKLADGKSGWVFNDQISPCEVRSDSRSQIASVSEQPQQCLAIASSVASGARIFTQPSRNAYLGRRIPQGTKVTSIGEQQEFVKIRLADGTSGWVFNDQVNPCTNL
ncbi:MAG TPA: SH3 domain-containing protein, partial [Leptolyngbyaceae cyanobacterium]